MNNISFQGKSIIYPNPQRFKEIVNNTEVQRRTIKSTAKTNVINKWKAYQVELSPENLVVVLNSEKGGCVTHIPTNNRNENILSELCDKIDEFTKKAKNNITAWIIGGDSVNGANGTKTIETLDDIADIVCDKPNIDASILVGAKKGQENCALYTRNNEIELTFDKPIKLDKNASPEENLEQIFDITELNNTELKCDK